MALLEFAISACPDLLRCPSRLYKTRMKAFMCDNFLTIYKTKSFINVFSAIDVTDNGFNVPSNVSEKSSMMHCPEIFPLILICNSEKDAIINAAALQILAKYAHKSISRWITITNSQLPTAIWTVRAIYKTSPHLII